MFVNKCRHISQHSVKTAVKIKRKCSYFHSPFGDNCCRIRNNSLYRFLQAIFVISFSLSCQYSAPEGAQAEFSFHTCATLPGIAVHAPIKPNPNSLGS